MSDTAVEDLLRDTAPQVLAVLARRYGDFAAAEDATQEALIAAARHWPADGVPASPRGWLIQTGARKLLDQLRNEQARRRREELAAVRELPGEAAQHDDTLTLLFLCCHPALSPASAIALTLRAVGGLSTAEIARAFLVPEATLAQRISRAKQRIRDTGTVFAAPAGDEFETRLRQVRRVLYLIFNEGYAASTGAAVHRADLAAEAIRLARMLPADPESIGLYALMLLTDARRPARTDAAGGLVPLDEQDRTRWDRARIAEGTALLDSVAGTAAPGEYQIQAAIAALHDRAPGPAGTDWPQIHALYGMLDAANPVVALNKAIAAAMIHGPEHGLALIAELELPGHRLAATRAHLHERAGHKEQALAAYRLAAEQATSIAERDHLILRASRLRHG
ncbi:RNA polymerase sigma factor [Actinoplanes sp. NPDC049265]|uniref:RNA polymerase sigma factor n=1 Tax=Actinoplanes sp. NPDC049265 TaxID=3363902 RepID=UPI0037118367